MEIIECSQEMTTVIFFFFLHKFDFGDNLCFLGSLWFYKTLRNAAFDYSLSISFQPFGVRKMP